MKPANRLLRTALAVLGLLAFDAGFCQPAPLPGPAGLNACRPGDPITHGFQLAASKYGTLAGCYVSAERIGKDGSQGAPNAPRDYALAIELPPAKAPYSRATVAAMFAKVKAQWGDVKALDHKEWAAYVQRVNAMLAASRASDQPAAQVQLQPPTLVSIERVGDDAYLVVTLRQRTLAPAAGPTIVSTGVEGSGVVLRGYSLFRIEAHRELQSLDDVKLVRERTKAWLAKLAK